MKHKWNVILFVAAIFGFGAINLLLPPAATVSELEKRDIAP